MGKNFFVGVVDQNVFYGTKNDLEYVDTIRSFTNKFVDSPETALLNSLDEVYKYCGNFPKTLSRWKLTKKQFEELYFQNITFDPKQNEYSITLFFTKDHLAIPSEYQMEQFENGVYEFYVYKYAIQILKTDLITGNLLPKAREKFIKQKFITK